MGKRFWKICALPSSERHQKSQSPLKREWNVQVVAQNTSACRFRHVHQQEHVSMHVATGPLGRSTYWSAFAYCYVPSARSQLQTCILYTGFHQGILIHLSASLCVEAICWAPFLALFRGSQTTDYSGCQRKLRNIPLRVKGILNMI